MAGPFSGVGLQGFNGIDTLIVRTGQLWYGQVNDKRSQFDLFEGDGLGGHAQDTALAIKLPVAEFIFELGKVRGDIAHGCDG